MERMKSLFLYMGVERVRTAYMSLQWERQIKERIGYIQLVNCLPIETECFFLYRCTKHQNGLFRLVMGEVGSCWGGWFGGHGKGCYRLLG